MDDHTDLPEQQRRRFLSVLVEESEKLSGSARALFEFMSERQQVRQPSTPAGEVDDFIIDHNNYFPELEREATTLFDRLEHGGVVDERALIDELTEFCGIEVKFDHAATASTNGRPESSYFYLDPNEKFLVVNASLPQSTLRFQLARVLFGQLCKNTIAQLVQAETLTTVEARERAFHALARYGAGALLLPYDSFFAAAEKLRYDVQVLMVRFGASFEQVCHRLVALRRPGASAVPFAFMRTDLAGNTTKRFSLPDLRLPRHDSACPLWAIYRAFLTPDRITTQLVRFPDDRQFLIVARAISKEASAFGQSPQTYSIMLACSAAHADRTVYGDAYASRDAALITEAGVSCRLCARSSCQQRAHAQILPPSAGMP